ncbi:Proteoglycan 4 [Dissostichus eleginoides]|uniref:Proteoglycan 4 n=1 Tax=Dissostichus eleginoides TaxID=100907 RepID=A0AAD9EUT1_DISEL|nr:Proteoglycan 4 [Dissostichus eleginoides]
MMEAPVCFLLLLSLALQPSDAAGPDQSCQGRCGETFSRGRVCECDAQCSQYSTCCHDYQLHCDAGVSGSLSRTAQPLRAAATGNRRPGRGWGDSNSESEEWYSARGPCSRYPRGQCPGSIRQLTASSSGRAPAAPTNQTQQGELLWSVDPVSRSVGGPQRITHTLGVSSPIDTVFTRCNCHAHTYIIKGDQFWRLDGNMVMEPGYPRPLTSEFPGLTGSIRAALAVPASRSSLESVYFFKSGDIMQRFSFPAGSAPSCSHTPSTPPKTRFTRQAGLLGAEVNIRVSLKGFPSPVTSALSRPQRRGLFEHYVFSGPLFFSVHISGDLLVLTTPPPPAAPAPPPILSPVVYSGFANMAAQNANTPPPANSIRVWLRCP